MDETTEQVCKFCEEVVVFEWPSEAVRKALFDPQSAKPKWRHKKTGEVRCASLATPIERVSDGSL